MPVKPEKILILGGTREAALLVDRLLADGADVITSLAGRTKEAKPLSGKVRIGGFGGVDGLANWLIENQIDRFIDATHPFAQQISSNAIEAAAIARIPLEVQQRELWEPVPHDKWISVQDIHQAAETIPVGARVFLALGHQHISVFTSRKDVFFLVRMVDKPETELAFANYQIILGRPSLKVEDERKLLLQYNCTHVVCRNSGGEGAYAKIEAARHLNLPIIMISRPKSA